jgi:uncharacterized protein YdaU (DUF1376 family)
MSNSGREDQKPWDKWYWQDYLSDTGLQLCSLAAQGLWMQMLCAMARAKNKGYLLDGEKQMESKTLAKLARSTVEEIEPLVQELRDHQVFSETDDGVIFNRRMVREADLSEKRSKAGAKGGRSKKQKESKTKAGGVKNTKPRSASASVSASAYASEKQKEEKVKEEGKSEEEIETDRLFQEFWEGYPQDGRLAKQESLKKFRAIVKRGELSALIKGTLGYIDYLKHRKLKENFEQRPMYAKTFLNGRWQEFVGFEYEPDL